MQPLDPVPSFAQLAWHRTETNLFIHFGMNTFSDREWGDGTESPALFNPARLDCRQWAQVARKAGFRIGILTAKHHDGFCLWPTATTDHSVKSSPWREGRGDLVREFADAFRAEGLRVGLYLSPWDRHERCYGDSPVYNDFYCAQLTELLIGYGELDELWFDGACAEGPNGRRQAYDWERFFGLVRKFQPGAVTFGDGGTDVRWVGNERGYAGETCWSTISSESIRFPGDSGIHKANDALAAKDFRALLENGEPPDGRQPLAWRPPESDVSIRPGWFYHEIENTQVRAAENLLEMYFHSVGRNSLLLLNVPPTPEGLIHDADIQTLHNFRMELNRLFARNLARSATVRADTEHSEHAINFLLDGNPDTYWAAREGVWQATLEIELAQLSTITVICLQEPIQIGQRIARYHVEARDTLGQWNTISTGTTIGNKKLDRISPVTAIHLRVSIDESLATPALASIELY